MIKKPLPFIFLLLFYTGQILQVTRKTKALFQAINVMIAFYFQFLEALLANKSWHHLFAIAPVVVHQFPGVNSLLFLLPAVLHVAVLASGLPPK